MQYKNIIQGIFKERLNRFCATVEIDGVDTLCHVKNTGRLKELLLAGAPCALEVSDNPNRKTKHDLIAVLHEKEWVNIDSMAPNVAAKEFLEQGGLGEITLLKAEQTYKTEADKSRFDFYAEFKNGDKAYIEVKGVTLLQDGVARFPDAPTTRGARHVQTLAHCVQQGFRGIVLFIVQRQNVKFFSPNDKQDKDFANTLRLAHQNGVEIYAVQCKSGTDYLHTDAFVPVHL